MLKLGLGKFGLDSLGLGKYRTVILLIGLFLVIFSGVMVLTFLISRQIAADAVSLNLAGQQRTLVQQLTKNVLLLEQGNTQGVIDSSGKSSFSELQDVFATVNELNTALAAFREGGKQLENGLRVELTPQDDVQAAAFFKLLDELWAPINQQVQQLKNQKTISSEEFGALLQVLVPDNLNLLEVSNLLTARMEALSADKAAKLRLIQTGGISLALINFAFILYLFLGQLRSGDQAIERAHKENSNILRTMQEGLFLLDSEFRIGTQTSKALSEILGVRVTPGDNFMNLLKPLVTPKTFDTAKEYIELLLRHDVKEKLVASLNPLDALEINTTLENGAIESRYLNFRFNRVVEGGKVTHLLVTAADITRRIRLERELQSSERKVQDQMGMMVHILQADPRLMQDFLSHAVAGLDRINDALKSGSSSSGFSTANMDNIFRIAHRLKGDATALNLDSVAKSLHAFEEILSGMRSNTALRNEDLLPVIVRVKSMYAELNAIQEAMARIAQVRGVLHIEPSKPVYDPALAQQALVKQWCSFAEQIAQRHGKQVELRYQGLNPERIPEKQREAINTMINQFIRNAVMHGLETPEERRLRGKSAAGRIAVYVSEAGDGTLELSFRDDGAGLSQEKLRATAVRTGKLSATEAEQADARQLTALIFEPGFSTRETVDEDAGRGVGLDAVKELVTQLRGRIRIGTTQGEYCHFRVHLPLPLEARSIDHSALEATQEAA